MKLTLLLLAVCFCAAYAYDGHQLLIASPKTEQQKQILNKLRENVELDFWRTSDNQYDILVPPAVAQFFKELMKVFKIDLIVANSNIQNVIDEEARRLATKTSAFKYDDFNRLEEIYKELDVLAAKCVSGFECSVDVLGKSVEKRPIKRLTISKKQTGRKIIWLDATTHAREWLTTATILKIIKNVVDNYGSSSDVTNMLDGYDWHFVPVVNPDGYEFTWTPLNRLWRKNRSYDSSTKCYGVDLNRNADHAWGAIGASSQSCASTYHGPSPASEPEIKAIQDVFLSQGSSILEIISFHSYGHYWLIPFGNYETGTLKCYVASDAVETKNVADAAANAIENEYKTTWVRGPTCSTIYVASGGMTDFAKSKAGVKYTAVPELRGDGFVVPPSEIEPSFREVWAGVVASVKEIEHQQSKA